MAASRSSHRDVHPAVLRRPYLTRLFGCNERRAVDRTSSSIGKAAGHRDSANVHPARAGRLCAYVSFRSCLTILDRACSHHYGFVCFKRNCRASETTANGRMDLWSGCSVYADGGRYSDDLFLANSVAPRPLVSSTLCVAALGNDPWKHHDRYWPGT